MPTKKPRVWVTLEPEAYEVLQGMAKMGNTTPGRVLSELAAPVLPALKRLVEASNEFSTWERSMRDQLGEVHQEVTAGIDLAIRALEARTMPSKGPGGSLDPVSLPRALEAPASLPGGTGAARASMPRSARAGSVPEGSTGGKTPPTNRGVILTALERNQRVRKGGPKRGI